MLRITPLLLIIALFAGCQSGPSFQGYVSPYPKGSAVAISPSLEHDAIKSLRKYLDQKYGSDEFEIISRTSKGTVEDLIIDNRGRLWKGTINEIWEVRAAGLTGKHEFIMYPDGKGGNYVGFKEVK